MQTSPDSLGKEGSKLTQALFTILWSPSTHPLAREGLLGAIFSHSFWRVASQHFHDSKFCGGNLTLQDFESLSQHTLLRTWVPALRQVACVVLNCCIELCGLLPVALIKSSCFDTVALGWVKRQKWPPADLLWHTVTWTAPVGSWIRIQEHKITSIGEKWIASKCLNSIMVLSICLCPILRNI